MAYSVTVAVAIGDVFRLALPHPRSSSMTSRLNAIGRRPLAVGVEFNGRPRTERRRSTFRQVFAEVHQVFFSGRLTGFYLILIDLTAFSLGFYRGLSVFTGFHLI